MSEHRRSKFGKTDWTAHTV